MIKLLKGVAQLINKIEKSIFTSKIKLKIKSILNIKPISINIII